MLAACPTTHRPAQGPQAGISVAPIRPPQRTIGNTLAAILLVDADKVILALRLIGARDGRMRVRWSCGRTVTFNDTATTGCAVRIAAAG